jgi:hypothetical protein
MTEEATANSSTPLTSRGWTLRNLVDQHENFKDVVRISAHASSAELLDAISDHERNGTPLVIEGYHTLPDWPREQFTLEFLERCAEPRTSSFLLKLPPCQMLKLLLIRSFCAKCTLSGGRGNVFQ